MELPNELKDNLKFSDISINSYRIVEDQSRSTTRKLVDTLEEHDALERLIDENKPKMKLYNDGEYFKNLHYLLMTPFRYPPLKWGSRFGLKHERSIFYSAASIDTAMAEKAFYLLAFLNASDGNIGGKTKNLTSFKAHIKSQRYIDLCSSLFKEHEGNISSKVDYKFSQSLEHEMRNKDVECFRYMSARDPIRGYNYGVFSPRVLSRNSDLDKTFTYYNCYFSKDIVEFTYKNKFNQEKRVFPKAIFLVDGSLPRPVD
ncbi:RES family NAD+ phosphorylase [Candidatus Berkiella cookevillensis]|uniref:RES domain protein n=1 Tax=Candidatus Berkiella cookevillensis TaxID=437022 RepID=A0A0Q9YMG6_9GAMM|nr:RES family NAD+ phosphorylase [Candidatus Berkiella cookevillensis]MCS5709740.1 RES family NAD+ phosphorylase [Candidatus Berkiella cookevillensis]